MSSAVSVRVLGRFEVLVGDTPAALGGMRQRAVLAILTMHRGSALSLDRVVDELWGGEEPATGRKAVQVYVSQLRRALGDHADVLATIDGGYRLSDEVETDVDEFERLVAEGRRSQDAGEPEAAAAVLRQALAVWRGDALADFAYESFAREDIRRLEEARLAATELRVDADLRCGRHADVVGELEAMVADHPLRERLRGQLMLALYRCGRQGDALETYQHGRRLLSEELGIDPGPELQRMQAAILAQDPELELPERRLAAAGRRRVRVLAVCGALLLAAAIAAAAVELGRGGSAGKPASTADSLSIVDAANGAIVRAIPVGASPGGVAAGADAVWVANTTRGTVARVDISSGAVDQTIGVGAGPDAVAVGGGSVWVANSLAATVSRISPAAERVVQTIRVGNGPVAIAYSDGAVWVANSVDGTISRIDPRTGIVTRVVPAVIGAAGLASGFNRLWIVSPSAGLVVALDPATGRVVSRIGVGVDPDAVTTGAGAVWVANGANGDVSKINPQAEAVTETITVGSRPDAIADVGGAIWVANGGSGTLSEIGVGSGSVMRTVNLSNPPEGLAGVAGTAYVTAGGNDRTHRGGALRVSVEAPGTLDPAVAYNNDSWSILSMTNDGLVTYDRVGGIHGSQLVPDLAQSLPTPTDGGKTYTFTLRPGIRFSNGEAVAPEDFRTAIQRLFEVGRAPAAVTGYYTGIVGTRRCRPGRPCNLSKGIVTDGAARTVTFHLAAPDGDFLEKLALPFADAVPPGTPRHALGSRWVPATGPYMVASASHGSVTLRRNPLFRSWSADARPDGYPDVIELVARSGDSWQGVQAVVHGHADAALDLSSPPMPKTRLLTLTAQYADQLHLATFPATEFFFLNTRVPPFDDLRARLAVNYGFDRQSFARELGPGFASTCQILPPDFPAYRRMCPYGSGGVAGLDRAQQLVRSSGTGGDHVTVWAPAPRALEARYMVTVLDSIGYRADARIVRGESNYFSVIENSRTRAQIGFDGWESDFPSDAGFLTPLFECSSFVPDNGSANIDPSEFCDRTIDKVLAQASATESQNPADATDIWERAERLILAKAPIVPTYNKQIAIFLAKPVGNLEVNPEWGVLLDQLWVK